MNEAIEPQQDLLLPVHVTPRSSSLMDTSPFSGPPSTKGRLEIHNPALSGDGGQSSDAQPSKKRLWTRFAAKRLWQFSKRRCTSYDPHIMAWLPEIASLALAVLMLVAIIILLYARQNKTLPRWPSLLQLNSLIAIFSSLFKVSLLFPITEGISELKWIWFDSPHPITDFDRFDSASRGPWGSLKLLLREPRNFLTSFGAIVIVLALAIDPFTQQVLQFYSCPRPISGLDASIMRLNSYNNSRIDWTPAAGASFLDPQLLSVLYQGFLSPPANATAAIAVNCASGNCTFPEKDGEVYSSLALCASIDDISSSAKGNSSTYRTGEPADWSYILPSRLNISGINTLSIGGTDYLKQTNSSSLFTFEVLSIATDCTANPAPGQDCTLSALAFRVGLEPCIETYRDVRVSNSILQQTVIRTTKLEEAVLDYCSTGIESAFPNTDCSPSPHKSGKKTTLTTRYGGADLRFEGPRCIYYPEFDPDGYTIPDGLWYDPDCIFSFSTSMGTSIASILHDNLGSTEDPKQLRPGSSDLWERSIISSSALVLPFWKPGSLSLSTISQTMGGVTSSFNAALRAGENPLDRRPAQGIVMGNQTCTGVAWAWLALPISLFVVTIAFLTAVISVSLRPTHFGGKSAGRRPWKSSASPLLWCGLQDATKEKYGSMNKVLEMQRRGDDTYIQLHRSEDADGAQGRWLLIEHPAPQTFAKDKSQRSKWLLLWTWLKGRRRDQDPTLISSQHPGKPPECSKGHVRSSGVCSARDI